jgi:23S rRNA pseudouridine1911/1915/1917 synthase
VTESEWIVGEQETAARLDKYLAAPGRLESRSRAQTALERGKVFVNGQEVAITDASRRLRSGDVVRLWIDRPGSARRSSARAPRDGDLPIVYRDPSLVVINKPAGLLTVPLGRREDAPSVQTLLPELLRSHGKVRPLVVHRIDRDTSGLVVFALRPDAWARLKAQFRDHEAERVYVAIVYGRPAPPAGVWRDHLVWDQEALIQKETHARDPRASLAISKYRVVEQFLDTALIEVQLVTGRRNQIRLQARLRGHTLVGEQRYTYGDASLRPIPFERQALHAKVLGFRHPADGRALQFEAPVPADMAELIKMLRNS